MNMKYILAILVSYWNKLKGKNVKNEYFAVEILFDLNFSRFLDVRFG